MMGLTNQFDRRAYKKVQLQQTIVLGGAWEFGGLIDNPNITQQTSPFTLESRRLDAMQIEP